MSQVVIDTNNGGRVTFEKGSKVRIIELSGSISGIYLVDQERSDRNGLVHLISEDGSKSIKVHYRRVLTIGVDSKAIGISSGDKHLAISPTTGHMIEVAVGADSVQFPDGNFEIHWLKGKEMETAEKTAAPKAPKAPKPPKPEKAPKPPKPEKAPAQAIDLQALTKINGCELWTKTNVSFDHATIDVKAHVLLYTGEDGPRKLCFNTYNGTLGGKAASLPIEEFVANKPNGKATWFAVKTDAEKARAKLTKDGYAKQA